MADSIENVTSRCFKIYGSGSFPHVFCLFFGVFFPSCWILVWLLGLKCQDHELIKTPIHT